MGKRRLLPTTEIINAFNNLNEAQKAMVFDYIKSQAAPKKSTPAQSAGQKSKANRSATPTSVSTGGATGSATSAGASAGGD